MQSNGHAPTRRLCTTLGLLAALWLVPTLPVLAADPCPLLRSGLAAPDAATRVAAAACEEHQAWYRPFIDREGRLLGSQVREAEAALLANGQPAWARVRDYWRGSGLMPQVAHRPGAADCLHADGQSPAPGCRSFLVDTPWSAAFVSWVMRRAALPGFTGSASHVDYTRAAYRDPDRNAYRIVDPRAAPPARGDMLCYVRVPGRDFGFAGLATLFSSTDGGLGMHCDIVVSAAEAGDRTARLVGGNVFDGVTMRLLPLTAGGQFENLPARTNGSQPDCSPDVPAACSANRQDWALLLQLRPGAELATLAPAPPLLQGPAAPPRPQCCVYCVLGSGIPRCPSDSRAQPLDTPSPPA